MQSDFDDTVLARPSRVAPAESGEPDTESTVVRQATPQPLIEPDAHDIAVSRPTTSKGVWANSVSVPVDHEPVLPPIEPSEAPVGVAYGFRLGNSPIVALDAVAYVGRRPSAPRVVQGGMPRLVRVESADHEISATHVELRQTGPNVVVTDMRSTNGTRVISPGSAPQRLRQGESVVVTLGTLIDLGDSVVLEIVEVPESS